MCLKSLVLAHYQFSLQYCFLLKKLHLSQGEKQLLLAGNVGEGIFFAGPHHAPIRIVSSEEEHGLISTNPNEKAALGVKPSYVGDGVKQEEKPPEEPVRPAYMDVAQNQTSYINNQNGNTNNENSVQQQNSQNMQQNVNTAQSYSNPAIQQSNTTTATNIPINNQQQKEVQSAQTGQNPVQSPEEREQAIQNQINQILGDNQNGSQ